MVWFFLWVIFTYPLYADTSVLEAKAAFLEKRNADLSVLMKNSSQSLLEPYFLYWDALLRLPSIDLSEATRLWQRLDGSPLANVFAAKWLEEMAKKGRAQDFLGFYPNLSQPSFRFQCYEQKAKKAIGLPLDEIKIRQIWETPKALGATCLGLFNQLQHDAHLSKDQILKRVRLLLLAGQTNAVKESVVLLPEGARFVQKLERAHKAPQALLDGSIELVHSLDKLLVLYAMQRLSLRDFSAAKAAFEKFAPYYTEEDQDVMIRTFAVNLAKDHDPEALLWFKKAVDLGDEDRAWQARQALRMGDWKTVALAIDQMSPEKQQSWHYWRAKAAMALGDPILANRLFAEAIEEEGFYGFLAAEEIGDTPKKIYWSAKNLAFQLPQSAHRAFLLYSLGLFEEADAEWRYTLESQSPQMRLALAFNAQAEQWWKAAITAARSSGLAIELSFFYPTPYLDLIERYARENDLDQAWVLGLMRQESLFEPHARSSSNARGLMQIIPPTGQWIAKRLGMPFDLALLNDPETNIAFGTHYMRYALSRLGHEVLATAGYNAGPGRPKKWLADHPLEGAIYIESIPFDETRDYVQKVLANTVIYSHELKKDMVTLSSMLGALPVGN
jgi:soluble lytic murein transglycosylase